MRDFYHLWSTKAWNTGAGYRRVLSFILSLTDNTLVGQCPDSMCLLNQDLKKTVTYMGYKIIIRIFRTLFFTGTLFEPMSKPILKYVKTCFSCSSINFQAFQWPPSPKNWRRFKWRSSSTRQTKTYKKKDFSSSFKKNNKKNEPWKSCSDVTKEAWTVKKWRK